MLRLSVLAFVAAGLFAPAPARAASPLLEPGMVGAWDVWISGAVQYRTDGRDVYQTYSPGAAMNRLEIKADLSYRWGSKAGKLVPAKPSFGMPGVRYFELEHARFGKYLAFYKADGDKLIVLFDVGGQAASGTRLGGTRPPPPPPATPQPSRIDVDWAGGNKPSPARQPKGSGLDVEWKTGRAPAPADPGDPCNPGPLGVVWAQCQKKAAGSEKAPAAPRAKPRR